MTVPQLIPPNTNGPRTTEAWATAAATLLAAVVAGTAPDSTARTIVAGLVVALVVAYTVCRSWVKVRQQGAGHAAVDFAQLAEAVAAQLAEIKHGPTPGEVPPAPPEVVARTVQALTADRVLDLNAEPAQPPPAY
jgi:hypothetical protein